MSSASYPQSSTNKSSATIGIGTEMVHPHLDVDPPHQLVFVAAAAAAATVETDISSLATSGTPEGLSATIRITNINAAAPVAFKIQTTNPSRYGCKPCIGTVGPLETIPIDVKFVRSKDSATEEINDKFQILSTLLSADKPAKAYTHEELAALLNRDLPSVLGHRLTSKIMLASSTQPRQANGRASRISTAATATTTHAASSMNDFLSDTQKSTDHDGGDHDEVGRLRREVARLRALYENSYRQQRKLSLILNFILAIMIVIVAVLMWATMATTMDAVTRPTSP